MKKNTFIETNNVFELDLWGKITICFFMMKTNALNSYFYFFYNTTIILRNRIDSRCYPNFKHTKPYNRIKKDQIL